MKIHFYLRFHTEMGQQLQVTGNFTSIGLKSRETVQMNYLNSDFWTLTIDIPELSDNNLRYAYQLINKDGELINEWGNDREILIENNSSELQLVDTWNFAGEFENAFYSAPFREILLPRHAHKKSKHPKPHSHVFKVKAPLLQKNEVVFLTGNGPLLGEWNTDDPLLLHIEGNWWTIEIDLPKEGFPLSYKYGIYNSKSKSFVQFEAGENRTLFGDALHITKTIVHDGFLNVPNNTWKGSGVSIPVFSLRSKESFGIGEFTDLHLLADWAGSVGMKLIQVLPINDTTATNTWTDSYPYAAISAFALHPIYINLWEVAGKKLRYLVSPYKKKQKELNDLATVDYEEVLTIKSEILLQIFEAQPADWAQEKKYLDFFTANKHWLVPYAAFCFLRDKYNTADFTTWKEHSSYNEGAIIQFSSTRLKHYHQLSYYYFVQYHLHLQLMEATNYVHKKGQILKGDIPIGIYRFSCDAWMAPELFHMDLQAGAPPDDFALKGQNWGFPTYNWVRMEQDGFTWWKQRFEQMSSYFDAFRIDHILGFFRIWSIPFEAVEGIMGHFEPSIPVNGNEFHQRGIWFEHTRYTSPYITEQVLWDKFGNLSLGVQNTFLEPTGYGQYFFKEPFNTQKKIEAWFGKQERSEENDEIRQGLYDLHSNVILFEAKGENKQQYHFRFGIESTSSFQALEPDTRHALKEMYLDYFYRRQDYFWMKEAMKKLPALKASTNMLICGEDLGMVPACVPEVMKQLGILSLEIQRMPKDSRQEFFHPKDAPYLSVITPSTHDMSTIRSWWLEDPAKTQRFYNSDLEQWGDAPLLCEGWINKSIIIQHLYSPAMWSIFQIQDLFGMKEEIRFDDPAAERINIPAIAKHYWRYRMHMPLEKLIMEKEFNYELKEYIKASGRD